jgi:hypothetical protein
MLQSMDGGEKEPWDFEAFVRAYNAIAKERGGWVWPGEINPEKLRGWYEPTSLWDSLRDFAETRYELDQEI